jgi:hypothetical protein
VKLLPGLAIGARRDVGAFPERSHETLHIAVAAHGAETSTGICSNQARAARPARHE